MESKLIYPLNYLPEAYVFLTPFDNCTAAALALEQTDYKEDFCIAVDFDPFFIARLMAAGFLVMADTLYFDQDDESDDELDNDESVRDDSPNKIKTSKHILLPKHHLTRSCLFFPELHVKKSIKKHLPLYDIYYDRDFDLVMDKCVEVHGDGWLTKPFLQALREIRAEKDMPVRPVSFALYRDNRLVAGEFGIVSGRVYTSYSGYYEQSNAGTVQMILTAQYLEQNGFHFWDLGMPLDYKLTIGAREISRGEFIKLFFKSNEP